VTGDGRPEEGPGTVREVQYKGAPLDAARGPGLGCFWIQLVALAVLVVLTPLSVVWDWPEALSGGLLLATLVLLLFAGQTVIFLLRLVAADRRAEQRRAPLAARTKTVGQIEDESGAAAGAGADAAAGSPGGVADPDMDPERSGDAGSGVPE
jgi:hypothetical protein